MNYGLLFLILTACAEAPVGVSADFILPQAFRSAEIRSIELFVVPRSALPDSGDRVCERFFADELQETIKASGSAQVSFDLANGVTTSLDIKVPPGNDYALLAQGWNVDIVAEPNVTPRTVIAVGCIAKFGVAGSQTTPLSLALCVCETPAPGSTSSACLNPTCPAN
jgi:hypothetical protein